MGRQRGLFLEMLAARSTMVFAVSVFVVLSHRAMSDVSPG